MKTLQCANCGNKQIIHELYKANFDVKKITAKTFSARRTPDRMHYRFVKCNTCGLIFSNPILPTAEITKLYQKSDFVYVNESNYLKKTYGNYLRKVLDGRKSKHIKLLDIGCGNGFFLEEAKALGIIDIWGIEPGKASVNKAPQWLQKKIKITTYKKNIFKKNTFDIICCFHTLDHIVNPNIFLEAVYNNLKKGGMALFVVHDTDGLSVKLFGEKSPIFDIEHIYLFNKKSLTKLFEKNNFTVVNTFSVKNKYPLDYWMRMSPLPKNLKSFLIKFLRISSLEKTPLSLVAGNIGIIVKK